MQAISVNIGQILCAAIFKSWCRTSAIRPIKYSMKRGVFAVPATEVPRTRVRLPKWNEAGSRQIQPGLSRPRPDADKNSIAGEENTDFPISQALDLIRQRSEPALLVVGPDNRLLYANKNALLIFKHANDIPVEIHLLCDRVRANAGVDEFAVPSSMNCEVFRGPGQDLYSLRAFPMGGKEDVLSHVMVMIERLADRAPINLNKARTTFGLSDREIEVVTLLARGFCNKEIASKLFISEHTVKGHLKTITRKIGAESRGNIIAILK
jgi:DNA-binding CsgD family transcriptional regulator